MDLPQLRYAVTLAEELHFGRAAERCNVSQPTLSQAVLNLERELGRPLFERSSRKVALTEAGRNFLPQASAALAALGRAKTAVSETSGQITGALRVGCIPTICPYVIPETLIRLGRSAPKLKIELHEETTSSLVGHLKSGRLDIGLLSVPISERGLSAEELWREPFYLAVSARHPLARRSEVPLKDVLREKMLILQEGHCFGEQSMAFCKLTRRDPQVSFEGSSLTSVLRLASAGAGVTFVPQMALDRRAYPGLRFLKLHPEPQRSIGVIWRLTAPLERTHQAFIEAVRWALRHGTRAV